MTTLKFPHDPTAAAEFAAQHNARLLEKAFFDFNFHLHLAGEQEIEYAREMMPEIDRPLFDAILKWRKENA